MEKWLDVERNTKTIEGAAALFLFEAIREHEKPAGEEISQWASS